MQADQAIQAERVTKNYGDTKALDGVSLSVRAGEILAVLGPNGAGKTTMIEILEGFRKSSGGLVRVLGEDPSRRSLRFRERVGVVFQASTIPGQLTVREIVTQYRGYYKRGIGADDAIDMAGLTDCADTRVSHLSGGTLRRVDIALALLGAPEVLFLDEPTTGFDPEARTVAWKMIRQLSSGGTTVVLTTHYLEEAERLADRIVVMAAGRVVGEGAASELAAANAGTDIMFTSCLDTADLPKALRERSATSAGRVTIRSAAATEDLATLIEWAERTANPLGGLAVRPQTLEDTYMQMISAKQHV